MHYREINIKIWVYVQDFLFTKEHCSALTQILR